MFQTGKLPDLLIVSHYTEEYFIWISVGPSFIVSMETGHCIRYTMHDSFCFQNCLNSSRHRFNMETFIRDFRPILTSYWHHDIAAYLSAAHPESGNWHQKYEIISAFLLLFVFLLKQWLTLLHCIILTSLDSLLFWLLKHFIGGLQFVQHTMTLYS